jgi:hypothetical protein
MRKENNTSSFNREAEKKVVDPATWSFRMFRSVFWLEVEAD